MWISARPYVFWPISIPLPLLITLNVIVMGDSGNVSPMFIIAAEGD